MHNLHVKLVIIGYCCFKADFKVSFKLQKKLLDLGLNKLYSFFYVIQIFKHIMLLDIELFYQDQI